MSAVSFTSSMTRRGGARWLLLGSLALNLFFVGIAVAMAVRPHEPPRWDRNVLVRAERIASSLPAADAEILRGQIKINQGAIEGAQAKYRGAQEAIRGMLRQEPFDVTAVQDAMSKARTARQNFDQIIQGVFASSAAQMSATGRHALADWPPRRKTPGKPE
jgi:uncharacterized membrane protein